jgi:NAD-dependent dihydropyrimidine dehydrogenase PreA subunit
MGIRDIIEIDEQLCDGCGQCVPSCAEGALQVINGKARLVSEVLCDGLGACLGHCPTGALKVIQRAAQAFDDAAVTGHLGHRVPPVAVPVSAAHHAGSGCPGSRVLTFDDRPQPPAAPSRHPANLGFIGLRPQAPESRPVARGLTGEQATQLAKLGPTQGSAPTPSAQTSCLRQWPVQLHLVPPTAPFFQGRHVLLAADCVPVAVGDFHQSLLDGRSLAIACPKLDQHLEIYVQKLAAMIDEGGILSLQVAIMEVPCCGGLARLAQQAVARAQRNIPVDVTTFSIRGERI